MMEQQNNMGQNSHAHKPSLRFWLVVGLALVWNLLGVAAYIAQVTLTPEAFSALPEKEQLLLLVLPAWYTAAFATAVFAASLGCVVLLLRKQWAIGLFVVSFIAVLAQQYYHFFENPFEVQIGPELVMTLLIPVVAALLIWFSVRAKKQGYLS